MRTRTTNRLGAIVLIVALLAAVGVSVFGNGFGSPGGEHSPEENCAKVEFNDEGPVWVADADYTEVRIKAGTEVYTWYDVQAGDILTVPTGKDVSYVIFCRPVVTTTTTTEVITTTTVTTVPPSTTTTQVVTTTSTTTSTVTTVPTTPSTIVTLVPPTTPTTEPSHPCEGGAKTEDCITLPYTGDITGALLILTALLTATGLGLIWYGRDRD
jgi:hypothetical protein